MGTTDQTSGLSFIDELCRVTDQKDWWADFGTQAVEVIKVSKAFMDQMVDLAFLEGLLSLESIYGYLMFRETLKIHMEPYPHDEDEG